MARADSRRQDEPLHDIVSIDTVMQLVLQPVSPVHRAAAVVPVTPVTRSPQVLGVVGKIHTPLPVRHQAGLGTDLLLLPGSLNWVGGGGWVGERGVGGQTAVGWRAWRGRPDRRGGGWVGGQF